VASAILGRRWYGGGEAVLWRMQKRFRCNSGDHSKGSIYNLLNNFKKSHIVSTLHIRAWCKKRGGVTYEDHPQTKTEKAIVLTTPSSGG
jgi:hypothetical protein